VTDHELTTAELKVLRGLAQVREDDVAADAQAVAQRAGGQPTPVREAINRLHEAGYVDPSLRLTDRGREVLAAAG
jgi:Mn-dependent DtxR family transcriptional regulator